MNISLNKVEKLVLCNFLLIYAVGRICDLFLGVDLHHIQLFHLFLGICGIRYLIQKGIEPFDYLVIAYISYLLLNGLSIDYNNHWSYFYRAFTVSIPAILFFYIGRYSRIPTNNILKGMKWPWVVLSIIGIYCFFMLPSWYIQMKDDQITAENVETHIREIYRLSSIWAHPYQITYATFLFSVFIIATLANNQGKKKYIWVLLLLCVIILLLGQIRVAILGFIISFFILFMVRTKVNWLKWGFYSLLMLCIISVILYVISALDVGNFKYIVEHMFALFEDNSLSNRLEHTSGGITHYTFWGDGYGRYGYEARAHNLVAIVDSEYQKHLAEVGYFGLFLLSVLLILTFLKSLKDKNFSVDFCIFLFYCFAMVGASTLSNNHQYGFLFWFCMGRIWKTNNFRFIVPYSHKFLKLKKRIIEYHRQA